MEWEEEEEEGVHGGWRRRKWQPCNGMKMTRSMSAMEVGGGGTGRRPWGNGDEDEKSGHGEGEGRWSWGEEDGSRR